MTERKEDRAPEAPSKVMRAFFEADSGIELRVGVSERTGITAYGFAYNGAPVPMRSGQGKFYATPDTEELLEWVMAGEPESYMKVTVTRAGEKVAERTKSKIVRPYRKGYDALKIKVS